MSGFVLLGLVLFGVEFEFGFELSGVVLEDGLVVLPVDGFMSGLLELVPVELEGEVEFMSELDAELLPDDGDVVEEGEVEGLEPVWLDEVDGVL